MPGASDKMNQTTIRIRIKSPVDEEDEPRLGRPTLAEDELDEALPSGPRYRPLWGRIITVVLALSGMALVALALLAPEEEPTPPSGASEGPASGAPGSEVAAIPPHTPLADTARTTESGGPDTRPTGRGEGAGVSEVQTLAAAPGAGSPSLEGPRPPLETPPAQTSPGTPAPPSPGPASTAEPRGAVATAPEPAPPVTEYAAPPSPAPERAAPEYAGPSSPAPEYAGPSSPAPEHTTPAASTAVSPPPGRADAPAASAPQAVEAATAGPAPLLPYRVARAQFTSGIREREPLDRLGPNISESARGPRGVYYFTELRDMQGHTAIHRWEHEGKNVAEIRFPVRGARWRVYSSKVITPEMRGQWQVTVTDEQDQVLRTDRFRYE